MNALRAELHAAGRVAWHLRLDPAGIRFRAKVLHALGNTDERVGPT